MFLNRIIFIHFSQTTEELNKKDLGLKYNLNLAKQLIEDCRLLDCSGAIGDLVEKILAKCNEFLLHLCDDIGRVAATIMTLYVDHLELKAEKNEKVKRLGFVNYLANNCCKQLNKLVLSSNFFNSFLIKKIQGSN